MDVFSFERLDAYQAALDLVESVSAIAKKMPVSERYGLVSQISRAVIFVPSNIAEQSGRTSYKEKIHFLEIAFGSLMECYCQLQIAERFDYITKQDIENIKPMFFSVARLINGLSRSFKNQLTL